MEFPRGNSSVLLGQASVCKWWSFSCFGVDRQNKGGCYTKRLCQLTCPPCLVFPRPLGSVCSLMLSQQVPFLNVAPVQLTGAWLWSLPVPSSFPVLWLRATGKQISRGANFSCDPQCRAEVVLGALHLWSIHSCLRRAGKHQLILIPLGPSVND